MVFFAPESPSQAEREPPRTGTCKTYKNLEATFPLVGISPDSLRRSAKDGPFAISPLRVSKHLLGKRFWDRPTGTHISGRAAQAARVRFHVVQSVFFVQIIRMSASREAGCCSWSFSALQVCELSRLL